MLTPLDRALDSITMYRLALYMLGAYVVVGVALAYAGALPFTPGALLLSTAFLLLICWAANTLLSWAFDVPTNIESATITALILALIFDPAQSPDALPVLGWVAILAMASKYLLALSGKHVFNPAAIAAVIGSFALGQSASWWVGTASMLPVVLIGGVLLVRKVRDEQMAGVFLGVALVTVAVVSVVQRASLGQQVQLLVVEAPLVFFASVMLTEPLTAPPTRRLKLIYAALVGVLFIPQIHVGPVYSTPELALVLGNVFAYAVSPRQTVALTLKRKNRLAPDILDFTFTSSQRLAYAPGQYLELTLGHAHADSRGNRRFFTLASSPTEASVHFGVKFYKQGSSFKRAMYTMDGRTPIVGAHVAGDFTLPADPKRKLMFIAGGIGITPFRSMLKYLLDTGQRRDIVLLYANGTADEIVYKDVLANAQTKLGTKIAFTLTDTSALPAGWQGYAGRVDERMIAAAAPDFRERTFYLSGPPDMVRAHEHALRAMGVHRDHIRTDFFPGLV